MKRTPKVKPVPEIVAPLKYKVQESAQAKVGFTDPVLFAVPFGTADYLCAQRAHELAHVKWTPRVYASPAEYAQANGIADPQWVQVCEDCRVNTLATQAGIKMEWLSEPTSAKPLLKVFVETNSVPDMVRIAVARTGCRAESQLIQQTLSQSPYGRAALEIAARIVRMVDSNPRSDSAIAAARYAETVFAVVDKEADKYPKRFDMPDTAPFDLGDSESLSAILDYIGSGRREEDARNRWGEMTLLDPPKFVPCNTSVKGITRTVSDVGVIPNRLHRLCLDGRIFHTTVKRHVGGSVLIDMSGSMSLPFARVTQYLQQCPLATIAVYSGDGNSKGNLVILAQHGKRVSACPEMGSGNQIDGPALRWLAKQPEPRVWVSDGKTTGLGDRSYGAAECRMLCRVHRIKRIGSFQSFLQSQGLAKKKTA